ncbi:hypothetical protein BKA64DRAFT_705387 [Cadophora sp. MPI-SDFR-AT-0126]|nr:hypothetical protein BKA64DRAFT_705387 [Leotiomycetes sp. MPI-SDFR-AT-0126]
MAFQEHVPMNALDGGNARPSDDLWGQALQRLKPANQTAIREISTSTNRLQVLQDVLELAQNSERTSQQKQWKWKNRKGEIIVVRDLFAKMVTWIEKIKGIGDTIVQYDPGHAALPWAAARLLLQASVNDIQTNGAMLDGLELVFNLIAKLEVIERLYLRRNSTLQVPLDKSIVTLYTSILEFLLESHRYFGQKTIKRIAKSIFQLEELTVKYTSNIERNMTEVEGYVRLLSGEISIHTNANLTEMSQRMTKLDMQSGKLDNVDSRLGNIQDALEAEAQLLRQTLDDLNEPTNRLAHQIRTINDNLKEEERLKIFEWLSTVEYRSHHRSKAKTLLPGSGQWLLKKREFIEWISRSTSSILWLHGIPGSGKSMLISHVIEYLQSRSIEDGGLAYFYCARSANEPERADPVELLRCLVEQMSCLSEDEPIQLPVAKAYKDKKKEARGRKAEKLSMDECVDVMLELLQLNPVTFVIDGLDECDPARRQDLLDAFQELITGSDNIVKIFVSSRDDHDLVHRLSKTPNLYIRASDNSGDIESFVKTRVDEAIDKGRILCGKVPQDLRNVIVENLIRKAEGMFRLVSLHVQSLCDPSRIKTRANVLDTLDHLPLDLQRSYDTIFGQITTSQYPNPDIADRVIKWLLFAQEQLPADVFAIAVRSDLDDQDPLGHSDILSICCNLVIHDDETNTFRFAHLSVLEYLERLEDYSMSTARSLLAEQCLSWIINNGEMLEQERLDCLQIYSHARSISRVPSAFPDANRAAIRTFSGHADVHWPQYARFAGHLRKEGRLKMLLETFLLLSPESLTANTGHFCRWIDRLDIRHLNFQQNLITSRPSNPLFLVTAFSLIEIVEALTRNNPEALQARNSLNLNCAEVAAQFDQPLAICTILKESRRLHLPVSYMKSAMQAAAQSGRVAALRAILGIAGPGFVTAEDFQCFAKEAFGLSQSPSYEEICALLFENNRQLEVDEPLWNAAFSNQRFGLTISRALLGFAGDISLTKSLISAARSNQSFGLELLHTILAAENKIRLNFDVREIIAEYRYETWIPQLIEHWKTHIGEMDMPGILSDSTAVRTTWNSASMAILNRALAADIDTEGTLLDIVLSQNLGKFELKWDHLVSLSKMDKGKKCLLMLLDEKPEMDEPAVNMILSQWDDQVVAALLSFREVEITDNVIKTVAGNMRSGAKVMQLLLEREAEMLELMD